MHAAAQHAGPPLLKMLLDKGCNPLAENLLVSYVALLKSFMGSELLPKSVLRSELLPKSNWRSEVLPNSSIASCALAAT